MRINRLKFLLKVAELQLRNDEILEALGTELFVNLVGITTVILTFNEASKLIALLGAENTFAVMDFGGNLEVALKVHRAVFG